MVNDFSYKHLMKIYGSERLLYDVYKRCMSKIDVIENINANYKINKFIWAVNAASLHL